ncbi:MAG: hypothetical protein H7A20_07745 [Rhodanobacteraceae bacterium]|nr:hypothetical protein [Rhodanobacteraceae bacterium]
MAVPIPNPMPGRAWWQETLLVAVALLLSVAAFVAALQWGGAWSLLAWIAFAPWFLLQRRLSPWLAAVLGGLFGLACVAPALWDVFAAALINQYGEGWRQRALTLAVFTPHAAPWLLFGWLDARWLRGRAMPVVLRPLLQSGLLSTLICAMPAVFPFTPALLLTPQLPMIQLAELGGEALVLWLMLWPSAALAQAWIAPEKWRGVLLPPLLCMALSAGYGLLRMLSIDAAAASPDGVSLSALPQQLDLPVNASARNLLRGSGSALALARDGLAAAPRCELLVWPELPVPYPEQMRLCESLDQDVAMRMPVPWVRVCARQPEGAVDRIEARAELHAADGALLAAHAKSGLIPGYERPLWGAGSIDTGDAGAVFGLDGRRQLIPAICYELHAREHIRRSVFGGGNVIVHMASFAPFSRQRIDRLDTAMAQLRAVEFRLPVLRSANRGPVGWIDANGAVHDDGARLGRGNPCIDLRGPNAGPTPYAWLMPVADWLPAGLSLLLWLFVGWRRRC